jgi:hypothetical protein
MATPRSSLLPECAVYRSFRSVLPKPNFLSLTSSLPPKNGSPFFVNVYSAEVRRITERIVPRRFWPHEQPKGGI